MPFCFFRVVFIVILTASFPTHALAQESTSARNLGVSATIKRVALVIGNDAYKHVPPLEKAGNDARAVGRALQQAGFETRTVLDANRSQMNKAINQFADDIAGGGIGVFFFAGHGVQVNNQNFLIPIDLQDIQREADVADQGISLQGMQDKLAEVRAKFSLLVIDACRDNPLPRKAGRALGGTRGLTQASSAEGQMVVFSAGANQQALDKLSDHDPHPNGVFTREFLPWIAKPGVSIRDAVQGVRSSVRARAKTVNHEQFPAIYDQAEGDFYFSGGPGTQVAGLGPQLVGGRTKEQIEDELWDAIKGSEKASVFEAYMREYSNGRYLAQARVRLAEINEAAKPSAAGLPKPAVAQAPAPTAPPKSDDPEADFWNEVKISGAREYYEAYLKQYPRGKYLALARVELKKLDDKDKADKAEGDARRLRAEQDDWNNAKRDSSAGAYAGYLERHPKGRWAALAEAALLKAQRGEAEREKQEAARHEREAREAEQQRLAAEKEAEERSKQEATRLAKEAAEMRPGKVFKDCDTCPEMVVIPAGGFEMGSNSGDADEKPVHTVRIGKPFAIGKTEVTQGQWRALMGGNPSVFKNCGDDCPTENISWDSARRYVQALAAKTGKAYRLPTEAEWEYACRAGSQHDYCGGNVAEVVAWFEENGKQTTHRVAGRAPNAWGLYDMSGNVWEWVADCYHGNYENAPADGTGWTAECSKDQRILRGGSWYESLRSLRPTRRSSWGGSSFKFSNLGLRVARDLE